MFNQYSMTLWINEINGIYTVKEKKKTILYYLHYAVIIRGSIRDALIKDGGSWHCTGDRDQDHPHGKEMQKSKMAVWGAFTNSCEKKRSEKQRRKGKIYPFECKVPKNSKER